MAILTRSTHKQGGCQTPQVTAHSKVSKVSDVYGFLVLLFELLLTGKSQINAPVGDKVVSQLSKSLDSEVLDLELFKLLNTREMVENFRRKMLEIGYCTGNRWYQIE